MTVDEPLDPHTIWNGQRSNVAYELGQACVELRACKPAAEIDVLSEIMVCAVTELWDANFSQTEIRRAFNDALVALPRYAAGNERRSDERPQTD